MKLLITGDWHISKKAPENRLDKDYFGTVLGKVKFIMKVAKEEMVDAILQPGDLFDSAKATYNVTASLAKLIRTYTPARFYSIPGQHDLHFHNHLNLNTPHYMLVSGGIIHAPTVLGLKSNRNHLLYTVPWEMKLPPTIEEGGDTYRILLIHKMIIKNRKEKIWPGQKDHALAQNILKKNNYDLIVSGDNHQSFISRYVEGGKFKYLFNCGSLIRTNILQANHKPFIIIFDTNDPEGFKKIFIPIQPFKNIMDLEKRNKADKRDEGLNLFIEQLKQTKTAELDYKKNVKILMRHPQVSRDEKEIINEMMGE